MALRFSTQLAAVAICSFALSCKAPERVSVPYDPLPPARMEDVIGVWIGYLPDSHTFYRLELDRLDPQAGGAGYLATVYSSSSTQLYRVVGWNIVDTTRIEVPLKPIDEKANPITLRGTAHGGNPNHLFLEIGAQNSSFRTRLVMYRELNYSKISDAAKSRISNARRESERP